MLGGHVRLECVVELNDLRALSWGGGFRLLAKTTARRLCSAARMGSRRMGEAVAMLLEVLGFC